MTDAQKRTRAAEAKLARTSPLRELADEVRSYPLRLLRTLAEQHALRRSPVPDHVLRLPPYLGETALRGLVEGGFVERTEETRRAIHAYVPTPAGLALIASVDGTAPSAGARGRASGRGRAPS